MVELVCDLGVEIDAGMLFKFVQTQLRARRDHRLVVRVDDAGRMRLDDEGSPEMDRGDTTTEKPTKRMYPCDQPGCSRVLSSSGNLARHRAMVHGLYSRNAAAMKARQEHRPRKTAMPKMSTSPYLECSTCGERIEVHYTRHDNPAEKMAVHTLKEHRRGPTKEERRPISNTPEKEEEHDDEDA